MQLEKCNIYRKMLCDFVLEIATWGGMRKHNVKYFCRITISLFLLLFFVMVLGFELFA